MNPGLHKFVTFVTLNLAAAALSPPAQAAGAPGWMLGQSSVVSTPFLARISGDLGGPAKPAPDATPRWAVDPFHYLVSSDQNSAYVIPFNELNFSEPDFIDGAAYGFAIKLGSKTLFHIGLPARNRGEALYADHWANNAQRLGKLKLEQARKLGRFLRLKVILYPSAPNVPARLLDIEFETVTPEDVASELTANLQAPKDRRETLASGLGTLVATSRLLEWSAKDLGFDDTPPQKARPQKSPSSAPEAEAPRPPAEFDRDLY